MHLDATVAQQHSRRHIGNLMHWLGNERLHADAWWADADTLARAKTPFPPPPPKEGAPPEEDAKPRKEKPKGKTAPKQVPRRKSPLPPGVMDFDAQEAAVDAASRRPLDREVRSKALPPSALEEKTEL